MNITIDSNIIKEPTFEAGELLVHESRPDFVILVTERPQATSFQPDEDQFWGIRVDSHGGFRCDGNWAKRAFKLFHGKITLEQP